VKNVSRKNVSILAAADQVWSLEMSVGHSNLPSSRVTRSRCANISKRRRARRESMSECDRQMRSIALQFWCLVTKLRAEERHDFFFTHD